MPEPLLEERSLAGRKVLQADVILDGCVLTGPACPLIKLTLAYPCGETYYARVRTSGGTLKRLPPTPIRIAGLRNEQPVGAKTCETKIIEPQ
jgi:hypothetical protein